MSNLFQFKQFGIIHEKSAMKIGTDSLLLACFAEIDGAKTILDIGTGTGILAIMMAQKSNAKIDAVEIDLSAFEEADSNAKKTKWSSKIKVHHTSIQQFQSTIKYDLIISNPPFYEEENNVKIKNGQRSKARHNAELSLNELAEEVKNRLSDEGKFWVILPPGEADEFVLIATKLGLIMYREIFIKPKPSKSINRIVMCFGKQKSKSFGEVFTIYDESGRSSEEYYELTREFLLWKSR